MTYIDNMGGFVSAKFILHSHLKKMLNDFDNNTVSVDIHDGFSWMDIDVKSEGVSVTVSVENKSAGSVFNISGSLYIKKMAAVLPTLRVRTNIILALSNTDRKSLIYGTDEYPVICSLIPLNPTNASGFVGYRLDFKGSQTIEPAILLE